jgi:hypothetical protein
MATAQANAAAPLDQLLVDVGAGPLRCWLPGRPGVEFIASLAGKPRRVGRRLSTMVDEIIGGDSRFILSTSGHIAAIVNPPGNPKAKIAGSSQLDWLQAVARSHTNFVTDLVSMYANAIRNGLSG